MIWSVNHNTHIFFLQNNKKQDMEKLKTENVDLYMANDTITESIQKLNEEIANLKTKNDHLEQINLECTTLKEQYNDLVRTDGKILSKYLQLQTFRLRFGFYSKELID